MNCLKLIRPRSFSRTFKIATIIAFVIFMCIQLGSYYRSYHEKKLEILQKYSDRVQDEKDKEYLARKPVVNSDEVEGYKVGTNKIDWHDWDSISEELKRKGPGEQGIPVVINSNESNDDKSSYQGNGFSGFVSDKISINRAVKDIRHPMCKAKEYLVDLPRASIVIPYYNEHWSTLLRTVHSVVNRTPPELLVEIILVDDASSREHCKEQVDKYLSKTFPSLDTRVIHLTKRKGLIGARLAGAKKSKGEVIIFLDSHTEANVNWLPPLLEPIAMNSSTVVCPFIDVIAYDTFEYRAQDEGARGAFDWELYYKRLPLLPQDLAKPTEPFNSPVMAGGLFAINANFFWKLGGYDEGLEIWGGEQYELSFKIWQCGGTLVDAPCSRVGHVYRKFAPFSFGGSLGKNYKRVAMVWMDEYAEYIYKHRPSYRNIDPGDISKQVELRQKLQCKPFKWFMEKVAFDLTKVYPPVEPNNFAEGAISSLLDKSYCIEAGSGSLSRVRLGKCLKKNSSKQKFKLTWHKDIRFRDSQCFDVSVGGDFAPVNFFQCHGAQGNQLWKYEKSAQTLVHVNSNRCLEIDTLERKIFVSGCVKDDLSQKWTLENLDEETLAKWNDL